MLTLFSSNKPTENPEDELLRLGKAIHEARLLLKKAKATKDEALAALLEAEDRGEPTENFQKGLAAARGELEKAEARLKHREDRLRSAIERQIDAEIESLPELQQEYKSEIEQQTQQAGRALGELLFYCRSLGLASEADGIRAAFFGPHGTPRNPIAGQIWGSKGRFKGDTEMPDLYQKRQRIAVLDRLRRMPYDKPTKIKRRFGEILKQTEAKNG